MQNENKEKYRQFCKNEKDIPIFIQPWWMDSVCVNGEWNVLLFEQNSDIKAVMVYYSVKRYGFYLVVQPPLTQYNGIWVKKDKELYVKDQLQVEKKIIDDLILQFEKVKTSYYNQNFNLYFKNWLPFYWRNYQQTTRYTYQIKDISNPEECFKSFSYAKQKQIKKCISTLHLMEISELDFYKLLVTQHKSRNNEVQYSSDFFYHLYKQCTLYKQGKIIAVGDEQKNIHAALFIVWDNHTAFNLISAIHPSYSSSGGSTLVVYEAIKEMSGKVQIFDFEGSMNKGIENSFSQFGTEQVPYFNIIKYNSFLFKTLFKLLKK